MSDADLDELAAQDAELNERSRVAATPDERAAVFGFDLPRIRRASRRLQVVSTIALAVGVVVILVILTPGELDIGSLALGTLLGFVAPVATFVLAQIVVRLFSRASTSALTIASAPPTIVLSSLLMVGALLLAPDNPSGFAGLLLGTWASASIETSGHVATARSFDRHNAYLPRTARMWRDYPAWATIIEGRWVWVLLFSVLNGVTLVAALLVFREGVAATALVIAGLAGAGAVEAWALTRGLLGVRVLVSVLTLAGVIAVWVLV